MQRLRLAKSAIGHPEKAKLTINFVENDINRIFVRF